MAITGVELCESPVQFAFDDIADKEYSLSGEIVLTWYRCKRRHYKCRVDE